MDSTQSIVMPVAFISILILDFKGDFLDLPDALGRDLWLHFNAMDGFRLGWAPPRICKDFMGWINQLTKVISAHCDLKFSETTLAAVLRIAFDLLCEVNGTPTIFGSPLLIEQLLQYLPRKMIAMKEIYLESVLQKISYIRRIAPHWFDVEAGFDVYRHLIEPRKCAVIDARGLSPFLADLLVNLLALQANFVKIGLGQVFPQTNYVMVVDEGDPYCSKEASAKYPEGYSEYAKGYKQLRAFGGMNVVGVTSYRNCSPIITANTSVFLIGSQADPDSTTEAALTFLEPSSRQLISSLRRGQFILKEAMGPVSYGMLVKAHHFPPVAGGNLPTFDKHDYTPARGISDIPGFRDRLDRLIAEYRLAVKRQQASQPAEETLLGRTERTFLDHMSLHEFEPLDNVFARMGSISAGTQNKLIDKLVRIGLIEAKTVRTGRSWTRFGRITPKGLQYLGKTSQYAPLRGGVVHTNVCYLKQRLDLKHGCEKSFCEHRLEGSTGFHDVVSIRDGKYYVTEVVIDCDANIVQHARDCLLNSKTPVENLTVITLLKSEHTTIREALLSDPELVFHIQRVSFLTVEDILKELYQ